MAAKFSRFHETRSYEVAEIMRSFCELIRCSTLKNNLNIWKIFLLWVSFSVPLQTGNADVSQFDDDDEPAVEKATLDAHITEVRHWMKERVIAISELVPFKARLARQWRQTSQTSRLFSGFLNLQLFMSMVNLLLWVYKDVLGFVFRHLTDFR